MVTLITILWSSLGIASQQSTIRDLTDNEVKLKSDSTKWGSKIFELYAKDKEVTPSSLDFVYRTWAQDGSLDKPKDQKVIYGLGVMFGNFVVSKVDSKWKVIIDKHGAGFIVVLSGGATIFPIDMVLKRVQAGNKEFGFFKANFDVIKSVAEQVQ
ncbi:DUF3806 domain-containing protein [Algibacillus agarilyticus]|uniref:DUF3806 domain-containing protein n=1 Tax=Algibacillus agarilyticus TaxID=2234133 RepID=UPI000DD0D348|nr:DUF3806 domain-containing protein [Algibacillus agarilyticus]